MKLNILKGITIRRSFRDYLREFRHGELPILFLAIIIAVAGTSSISFVTNRIELALQSQSSEFMGADLVIRSSEPISATLRSKAVKAGLAITHSVEFPTVVIASSNKKLYSKLSGLKAVSTGYPLRGKLKTGNTPYSAGQMTRDIPNSGHAWVDSELFNALRLKLGQHIQVGYSKLKVTRIITFEPDRGNEFFNIAPRLMINQADLKATRLIARGSRVRYKLLIAGPWNKVQQYARWAKARLNKNERLLTLETARPALRTAVNFGGRYLSLATLLGILLAGVAIAIAAQQYARNQLDRCAILRCLGATQAKISRHYLAQLLWLALTASVSGVLFGYWLHLFVLYSLQGLIPGQLPPASMTPVLTGLTVGSVTLFAFALPPVLALRHTSALRVIRRDLQADNTKQRTNKLISWVAILLGITILLLVLAGDLKLAWRMAIATGGTIVMLLLVSWLLLKALSLITVPLAKLPRLAAIRFGLNNLCRRPGTTSIQISGFGLGIMALLILGMVRIDLLNQWQNRLPEKSANQFLINIQPNQIDKLKQWLGTQQISAVKLYPMVRGRLVAINQRNVTPDSYTHPRAKRLVAREFNLSQSSQLQQGNRVIQGQWWTANSKDLNQVSMESGIAKLLQIKTGDKLRYLIAGQEITLRVTSIRKVAWDTMRPNFFAVLPNKALSQYPTTWIGSFYLAPDQRDLVTKLVKQFPNLTVIDVTAIISQIRNVMNKVVSTIEYVFIFTLLAGLLVLFSVLQASRGARIQDAAILKTLGGTRKTILTSVLTEFILIGMFAGLIASFGATFAAWLISSALLNIEFVIRPSWWLVGVLAGGLGTACAGLLGSIATLRSTPMRLIRKT